MMQVTFWGTRGSIPAPGPETIRFGGNTSCVGVQGEDGSVLILDAGTGIRRLGWRLAEGVERIDLLLTHLHMDHLQGLGFFAPIFQPGREVHIWGPPSSTQTLHARLARYLSPPLFPVHLRRVPSRLHIHDLTGEDLQIGRFHIGVAFVCHPNPTVGYRIDDGRSIVTYLPDHEPALGTGRLDRSPEWISGYSLAEGANLLIHDAQYSADEYPDHVGWGHSSVLHAVEFAARTGVAMLVPFHHDPTHSDHDIDRIVGETVRDMNPPFAVAPAREGATFVLHEGRTELLKESTTPTEEMLERRLRESQDRFELAVRCANDGIWDWDLATNEVYYSPRWKSMLGYRDDEIEHRYEEWESRVHPDDLPGALAAIQAHLRGETGSYQVEHRLRHKDGSYRWVLARGASLRNDEGERYRMAGAHTDITDRKEAEEGLKAAYGLLEEGVQERTREISALLDLSYRASSTLDLEPLLSLIVGGLRAVVDYDGASLLLREGDDFVFFHCEGLDDVGHLVGYRTPIHAFDPASELFRSASPLIIGDVRTNHQPGEGWRTSMGPVAETALSYVRSWIGAPLVLKDRVLGLLSVGSSRPKYYTERHARLALAIAQQAAMAVENARLFEQAQRWAATEERAHLARDLHDSVTQALYSMTLHARSTHMQLEREGIDPASPLARNVQHLGQLTRGALAEMRALLFELRPAALRGEGLISALRQLATAVGTRYGVEVDVGTSGEWVSLDQAIEESLYRLVQEALHHAARYAQARHIHIHVDETADGVRNQVRDDGIGLDLPPVGTDRVDLDTIAERAAKIGAKLQVVNNPGIGTRVLISVPPTVASGASEDRVAQQLVQGSATG